MSESAAAESPGSPEYQAASNERLRRQSRDNWARAALCGMMAVGGFLLFLGNLGVGFGSALTVVGLLLVVPSAVWAATRYAKRKREMADKAVLFVAITYIGMAVLVTSALTSR